MDDNKIPINLPQFNDVTAMGEQAYEKAISNQANVAVKIIRLTVL